MNQPRVWALIIAGIVVLALLAPLLAEIGLVALLRQLGLAALRQFIRLGGRTTRRFNDKGQKSTANFSSRERLEDHFSRHGKKLGYDNIDDYLQGARDMTKREGVEKFKRPNNNPDYAGDELFYDKTTGEFLSQTKDGTIKTYMKPRNPPNFWNNTTSPLDSKNIPKVTLR